MANEIKPNGEIIANYDPTPKNASGLTNAQILSSYDPTSRNARGLTNAQVIESYNPLVPLPSMRGLRRYAAPVKPVEPISFEQLLAAEQ